MANSLRHKQLLSRIKSIESNLLPSIKIAGNYTKKESDLIRSYVLLVHAEIESYFEDVAEKKAEKSKENWMSNRTKSNCLLSIMSFLSNEINWDTIQNSSKQKLDFRVTRVTLHYIEKLKSNHGVKSKNILNMLLPLGIESNLIDQGWLNTMDSFGAKRGLIAHSTSRVQNQIDLVTEKNDINNAILPEIKNLDELIKNIK